MNQQKYVQNENLKYTRKFENVHRKSDFRYLTEKMSSIYKKTPQETFRDANLSTL